MLVSLAVSALGLSLNAPARSGVISMATKTVSPLPTSVKPGVVTGQALSDLLQHAKDNEYAIPAVNVVSSCSISGCLEAAKKNGGPMIIQFSRGGGQ
jgi:fructose-bisphosphate aldolase class II